jgi:hypothetical protein
VRPARHRFWARVVDRDSHDAEAPRRGENDDELRWQSYIFYRIGGRFNVHVTLASTEVSSYILELDISI